MKPNFPCLGIITKVHECNKNINSLGKFVILLGEVQVENKNMNCLDCGETAKDSILYETQTKGDYIPDSCVKIISPEDLVYKPKE